RIAEPKQLTTAICARNSSGLALALSSRAGARARAEHGSCWLFRVRYLRHPALVERMEQMRKHIATWLSLLVGLVAGCQKPAEPEPETKGEAPAAAAVAAAAPAAKADDTGPVKIGILHSLSGTMAISETSLKDVALMTIEEINQQGGLLGRKLEPVVVDPASNWPLFAEKARELLQKDHVAAVFGCWTSVSRKSVLPVFEELNGLLFYPVQYEGEESSWNVFYTGAAPNQQAIPAVDYLMKDLQVKRWVL